MRILIADDEQRYREYLRAALLEQGHVVRVASNGWETIDAGCEFDPQLLIADWLLKCDLHGVRVARALQALSPEMKTIVITGFPSGDLRAEVRRSGFHRLIEKPFPLSSFLDAVHDADEEASKVALVDRSIAIAVLDSTGTVVHNRNWPAAERDGSFSFDVSSLLESVSGGVDERRGEHPEWTEVSPEWQMCSRALPGGGALVVLLASDASHLRWNESIRTLLRIGPTRSLGWPPSEHILAIDMDSQLRGIYESMWERVGGLCYAVHSRERALRLLSEDVNISVVLLGADLHDRSNQDFVTECLSIRPTLLFVSPHPADARQRRVLFVEKPWTIDALVERLSTAD
jgi:DNA-binding NtrC family response regulator